METRQQPEKKNFTSIATCRTHFPDVPNAGIPLQDFPEIEDYLSKTQGIPVESLHSPVNFGAVFEESVIPSFWLRTRSAKTGQIDPNVAIKIVRTTQFSTSMGSSGRPIPPIGDLPNAQTKTDSLTQSLLYKDFKNSGNSFFELKAWINQRRSRQTVDHIHLNSQPAISESFARFLIDTKDKTGELNDLGFLTLLVINGIPPTLHFSSEYGIRLETARQNPVYINPGTTSDMFAIPDEVFGEDEDSYQNNQWMFNNNQVFRCTFNEDEFAKFEYVSATAGLKKSNSGLTPYILPYYQPEENVKRLVTNPESIYYFISGLIVNSLDHYELLGQLAYLVENGFRSTDIQDIMQPTFEVVESLE